MNKLFNLWHTALSSVSIINVIIITYYSFFYKLSNDNIHKYLIILSFIYSIVCSFRAIWLKKPVQQLCLNSNFFSSPFIGRTLATIAELSFATQIITFIKFITKEIYTQNKKQDDRIQKFVKLTNQANAQWKKNSDSVNEFWTGY